MSIVQVKGGGKSKGAVPADRTLFVGVKVPEEIKRMIKPLKQTDRQDFRKILQVTVASLEGRTADPALLQDLKSGKLNEETVAILFSGIHRLLTAALRIPRTSLRQEVFKEDLVELRIPEEFIPDLASAVFGSRRNAIDQHSEENRPHLPKLQNFRWRVDVAISTSALSRALEPCVMMEMTLSNGEIKSFEVPLSKFHELRYNVAFVLKEMEDVEKRSILKIQD